MAVMTTENERRITHSTGHGDVMTSLNGGTTDNHAHETTSLAYETTADAYWTFYADGTRACLWNDGLH